MEIIETVKKCRDYFQSGKTKDVDYRIAALKKLRANIVRYETELKMAMKSDFNRSFFETYMCEIYIVLEELNDAIKNTGYRSLPRKAAPGMANFMSKCNVVPEPYGVTLIISPWNYPIQLTFSPLIGAIAAGNICLVKPSNYTSATSAIIAKIISESFEPGHVHVILGGREQVSGLLEQRFDYIFFTGSVDVGKVVMSAAAKNLTPVTLELGGKSPCIVLHDADIDKAAKRIVFGKFLNAGQTCIAPDYVLCPKSIEDELVGKMTEYIKQFYYEKDLLAAKYCHLVSDKHFERVKRLIIGDKVVFGGRSEEKLRLIEPTIMTNIVSSDAVMQEEIFGPVLPILTVNNRADAVEFINNREKPLALYVFTKSKKSAEYILDNVSSGGACVNDTVSHVTAKGLPFGGVGNSGMGMYHKRFSFDTFSHLRGIMYKGKFDPAQKYPPYTDIRERKLKRLLKFIK